MPIYSYVCSVCNHEEDIFQKITDSKLIKCPKCKKDSFSRKIGGANATFQFKGDGFYCNDYKTKSDKCSQCNRKNNK